jgi:hypothetical protein
MASVSTAGCALMLIAVAGASLCGEHGGDLDPEVGGDAFQPVPPAGEVASLQPAVGAERDTRLSGKCSLVPSCPDPEVVQLGGVGPSGGQLPRLSLHRTGDHEQCGRCGRVPAMEPLTGPLPRCAGASRELLD